MPAQSDEYYNAIKICIEAGVRPLLLISRGLEWWWEELRLNDVAVANIFKDFNDGFNA